jgi:hypothetical protein
MPYISSFENSAGVLIKKMLVFIVAGSLNFFLKLSMNTIQENPNKKKKTAVDFLFFISN